VHIPGPKAAGYHGCTEWLADCYGWPWLPSILLFLFGFRVASSNFIKKNALDDASSSSLFQFKDSTLTSLRTWENAETRRAGEMQEEASISWRKGCGVIN
jgi:hypothetical protein